MSQTTDLKVKFPIALKLILSSAAIVALVALGFVSTSLVATRKQYTQQAERLKETEIRSLRELGTATARNVADGSASALLEGDVRIVNETVTQVTQNNKNVVKILIARPDGTIVALSGEGSLGTKVSRALYDALRAAGTSPGELQLSESLSGQKVLSFGLQITLAERLLGYLYLEMSTERIDQVLASIEIEQKEATQQALLRTIGLGVLALLLGIVIAVLQGFRFSKAIRSLASVAAEVGAGNLSARAQTGSNDELGVLSQRFNDMTEQIENLLDESVAKAALDQELARAKNIQAMLMPPRDKFGVPGFSYCGSAEAAAEVGGDWWHHYGLGQGRVLLCVGDVTGHGIPAAMLTASTKSCCDTLFYLHSDVDLVRMMKSLDHVIREAGKGELVMTMFAAVYQPELKMLQFVNAGHNFPMVVRQGKLHSLVARGGRLGDGEKFETGEWPLEEGDVFVLYTDGVIECENESGEEYGSRRLRKILRKYADQDVLTIRDQVIDDAFTFFGNQPRADDVTLVVAKFAA